MMQKHNSATNSFSPFSIENNALYEQWRDNKLKDYPESSLSE